MFTFANPTVLLLLGCLPLLAWLRSKRGRDAAFLYSSVGLVKGITNLRKTRAGALLLFLRWLALTLGILALARPRWSEGETVVKASGIDIVVALDLSGSMAAEDFTLLGNRVNRLEIAKHVLREFIQKRPNDRIGLIAFAGHAYIAAPLTLDHNFLVRNLERLDLHLIKDGTAVGSALSAGVNRLRDLDSKSRIMILMTDGQNNSGKIPPLIAAEAAKALQVKVYTIGVGTKGMAPVPRVNAFGRKTYVKVPVDIDEETLARIAETTGGAYYRADNTDTLVKIYDQINQLEKTEVEVKKFQRSRELFNWFLLPALGAILLEIILNHTVWRRLP